MPALTDEAWAQIRYDYEHTDRPVGDICAAHGISSGTLRDRMRRWNWTRRRSAIARQGPPALMPPVALEMPKLWPLASAQLRGDEPSERSQPAEGPLTPDPSPQAPAPGCAHARPGCEGAQAEFAAPIVPATAADAEADPASIAPRLQSAVARLLPAIEAAIAKLAAGPQHARAMEQTARTLGTLTRTLRELNALLAQHAPPAHDNDPIPENIDEFRTELARRIRAFVAARRAEKGEADAPSGAGEAGRSVP
jgi:hypothetical protein